ncbi:MAG: hypothetical protein ACOH2N_07940 [Devosia sp.]
MEREFDALRGLASWSVRQTQGLAGRMEKGGKNEGGVVPRLFEELVSHLA